MSEFKVGDIVTNTYACSEERAGMRLRITEVSNSGNCSTINLENGRSDFHGSDHLKLVEKTLDELVPGDIILGPSGYGSEVVLANDKYVVTLDIYDGSNDVTGWSVDELKKHGHTVKQDDSTTELTLDEIADKFNIDVKDLRIKE